MNDLLKIKMGMPEYLTRIGLEPRVKGNKLSCCCPVHDDTNPSFDADLKEDGWVAICRSCGFAGSVIDIHKEIFGLDTKDAIADLKGTLGNYALPAAAKRRVQVTKNDEKPISEEQARALDTARYRLYNNRELQERFALEIGVQPETIRNATMPADAAVGWSIRYNRPLYIYPRGAKVRFVPDHKPRFKWLCGRASEPWGAVNLRRPNVRRVFVTEGESDRLALLDAGWEDITADYGTAIVASPGTSFSQKWIYLFKDKEVILAFDMDGPGQKAAKRISELLERTAARVATFHLKKGGLAA